MHHSNASVKLTVVREGGGTKWKVALAVARGSNLTRKSAQPLRGARAELRWRRLCSQIAVSFKSANINLYRWLKP